jgi:serine/threonine-protein kinase
VLPFAHADQELDYVAEGITEDLINTFGRSHALRVMSRSAVYGYRNAELPPQELGRKLNVRFLVTGRVVRRGNLVSVAVELTNADDGVHVWGQQYERPLAAILDIEEDVTRSVLKQLMLPFGSDQEKRFASRRAADPAANELYWKARFFWNKRTQEGLQQAMQYLSAAIEKDPGFAPAHAGLADCYAMRSGVVPPRETFPMAKAAALKAIELDDTLAEGHASLAFIHLYFDWDWPKTETEYLRAIELNPSYPTAHSMYAMYLVAMKRFDEALDRMKRALELDPSSLAINTGVGRVLLYARRYGDAAAQYSQTLEMNPRFAQALYDLGIARAAQGRYDEAIEALQRGLESAGEDAGILSQITYVHRQAGRKPQAELTVQSLDRLAARRYVSPYFLAVAHVRGDNGRALEFLERAYQDRSWSMIYLNVDHRFDPLRSHPNYQSLLRRLNFRGA